MSLNQPHIVIGVDRAGNSREIGVYRTEDIAEQVADGLRKVFTSDLYCVINHEHYLAGEN